MNIFLKSLSSLFKIIAFLTVAYLTLELPFAANKIQLAIGFFVLIFITLPTIFIIFFKDNFFKKYPKFVPFWKIYRVFYVVIFVSYIATWILGAWHLNYIAENQKMIEFINSEKITLDDVMGKNLPPLPDQKINDSTVAGIDANKNYIRDDVELAIFRKYPNLARIRAAELQYAQEFQLKLISVYNSDSWVAAVKKSNNGISCIVKTAFGEYSATKDQIDKSREWQGEVESLVLNTNIRQGRAEAIDKYEKVYVVGDGQCDISVNELGN
jgi:hypothetical protein